MTQLKGDNSAMDQEKRLNSTLVAKTKKITRELRLGYNRLSDIREQPYDVPPDLYSGEVLGPWPVYIIHSYPCAYFSRNSCTPCSFSLVPKIHASKRAVHQSLINQCQALLDQFRALVVEQQTRVSAFPILPTFTPGYKNVILGFTTTGTFFGRNEVPGDILVAIFEMLAQFAVDKELNLCINIETRSEDVIASYEEGVLDRLEPALQKITVMNSLGLESTNEMNRNVLYCKGLDLLEFEKAVEISRQLGMIPNAFVFAGLHSLTRTEIVEDIKRSIQYLYRLNVSPIITLPNLSEFTLPHLLFKYDRMQLLDPRDVVEIVHFLVQTAKIRTSRYYCDPWYLGMADQEPNPSIDIFNNPHRVSCDTCTTQIYSALKQIRRDYNHARLCQDIAETEFCSCKQDYIYAMESDLKKAKIGLETRLQQDLVFAEDKLEEYLQLPEMLRFVREHQ